MLAHHFLEASAQRRPEAFALVANRKRWTYGELDSISDRLANGLLSLGVRRGDRVGIYLANCAEAAISMFAILKAGAVFVAVSRNTRTEKLAAILDDAGAVGLICANPELRAPLQTAVPSLRFFIVPDDVVVQTRNTVLSLNTVTSFTASQGAPPIIDLDLACLIYTSGSTGEPKGVMTDHSNMVFATRSIAKYLENSEGDRVLSALPLAFTYGLYQLIVTIATGGTLFLEESFAYPADTLRKIEHERITGFPGIPAMFAALLRVDLNAFDLSSLRYLTNAGGALPTPHIREIRRALPNAKFFSMYGLTEAKRVLYLPPDEIDDRPDSVGIPIPGTEAWIEDDSGERLGPGQTGELVVRGRHVMRGYWRAPQATAARFRPGPLPGERVCHTGDLFRRDRDGYFYFVARKDDMIKSRGEKIAPKQIEDVVCTLDGVSEAAAVGVADAMLGEAVHLYVIPKPGSIITESEILAHCRANLENFMVPKLVRLRSDLPRTAGGKLARAELKSCAESLASST